MAGFNYTKRLPYRYYETLFLFFIGLFYSPAIVLFYIVMATQAHRVCNGKAWCDPVDEHNFWKGMYRPFNYAPSDSYTYTSPRALTDGYLYYLECYTQVCFGNHSLA
jgi:hypothetical protein